jgi:hypothetical protein
MAAASRAGSGNRGGAVGGGGVEVPWRGVRGSGAAATTMAAVLRCARGERRRRRERRRRGLCGLLMYRLC